MTQKSSEVQDKSLSLCDCCAMKLTNDDDSACRDFYNHTHAELKVPFGTALTGGPFDYQGRYSMTCDGHRGEIMTFEKYWSAEKP